MSGSAESQCPGCKGHTRQENAATQGVILSGVEAMLNNDLPAIEAVSSTLTSYDAHVAISMLAMLLAALADMTGAPLEQILSSYRARLNATQAAGA